MLMSMFRKHVPEYSFYEVFKQQRFSSGQPYFPNRPIVPC